MVKKEREQRFATPAEVAAALQPFACAEPHRMPALLAPVSHPEGAPVDTGRILDERTQLAPSAPSAPPLAGAQPQSRRMFLWLAAAASLLVFLSVCILVAVIGAGMVWNKKDNPKEDGPIVKDKGDDNAKDGGTNNKVKNVPIAGAGNKLIDEDFRATFNKKMSVPEGWKSDEFTTFRNNEVYGMHPVPPTGIASVLVPLSSPLSANFDIEGVYHMDTPQVLTISLENREKSKLLPIVFDWNGNISIAKDLRRAPESYKPLLPTHFLVKREGTKIRVFLDDFPAVEKNLTEAPEFATLRLAFTAGTGYYNRRLNLHGLKVIAYP
jgi:hypothetical protein